MHCRSCELLLEKALDDVSGVKSVRANAKKGEIALETDANFDRKAVDDAVRTAGYDIGSRERLPLWSADQDTYGFLFFSVILVFVGYRILRLMPMSWGAEGGSSIALGLIAGFSTCMALVGGLVLGLSARHAERHPESTRLERFRPHIFFNAGRIVGFAALGGVLGIVGSAFALPDALLGPLMMIVGVLMAILGLQITGLSPRLSAFSFTLPSSIARTLGLHRSHRREYGHGRAFGLGALTFFLPCGFTQLAQLDAALSGNFVSGALIMGGFALGTAPGLFGIGALTSVERHGATPLPRMLMGTIVVALALLQLQGAVNIAGWSIASPQPAASAAPVENGVQIVRMEQRSDEYVPASFVIKRGVPVRWIVTSTDSWSCAASLRIPALGVAARLQPGENVIEFTAQKSGTLLFTCSMGMYSGAFIVVD